MIGQSLRLIHTGLSGVYRIDAVLLDGFKLLVCDLAFNDIGGCGTDDDIFIFL